MKILFTVGYNSCADCNLDESSGNHPMPLPEAYDPAANTLWLNLFPKTNPWNPGYGGQIIATPSQELSAEFGLGYSYSALTRMVKFADVFPGGEIVATLSQQLSWSHFRQLLPLEQPLQRDFYAEMCRVERWSVCINRDIVSRFGSFDGSRDVIATLCHDFEAPLFHGVVSNL